MDLSIIIPLYNCEQHIDRAFKVLGMQHIFDDAALKSEVILINDGSKDSTLSIARKYQEKYPNITIVSKKNEGQHIARNIGLDMAKGEYIYMMDVDDVLTPGCLKIFLYIALRKKPDVLVFGWRNASVNDIESILSLPPMTPDIPKISFKGTGEEYIEYSNGLISQDAIWHKFFRRETINQNHYRFADNIIYGEDSAFVWSVFTHVKNIIALDSIGYYYISHPTNYTNTMVTDKLHGFKCKSSQEYLALFLHNLIDNNLDFSPILKEFIRRKRDSYTVAYWAYFLRTGCTSINSSKIISRQKNWGIYPITSKFPGNYYSDNTIGRWKFKLLWNIINHEYILKSVLAFRNLYLKLFRKK